MDVIDHHASLNPNIASDYSHGLFVVCSTDTAPGSMSGSVTQSLTSEGGRRALLVAWDFEDRSSQIVNCHSPNEWDFVLLM